jgi:hypothetical protein
MIVNGTTMWHMEKQKKANNIFPSLFCLPHNHSTPRNVNGIHTVVIETDAAWRSMLQTKASRASLSVTYTLYSLSFFVVVWLIECSFPNGDCVCYLKHQGDDIHKGSSYALSFRLQDRNEKLD